MKRKNAYFTVEAALVFPMVMGTVLLVGYLMLFQYDRCLLEQDIGAMMLWGSRLESSDTKVLEELLRGRISDMYWEKYAAWETTGLEVKLEKNNFTAQGSGQITFPVVGWNFWNTKNIWNTDVSCDYHRLSPVTFIRLCHGFFGEEK